MGEKSVDVVFTSPPYNRKRNDKYDYYDDSMLEYAGFLNNAITQSIRIARKYVFFNIQKNYYNKADVFKVIGDFNEQITEIFIWAKSNPMPASGNNITNGYEYIIAFGQPLKSNYTYTKNYLVTSVAKMPNDHKAVMHKSVADYFIGNFCKGGDLVYDPFMGTGTTAKICMKHNVNCIGSESCNEYYIKYLEPLNTKH